MNARLALGGLLLLGLADLGLINLSLAPRLAEEQAKQAQGGRPGENTAKPTAPKPSPVPTPSVAVAPSPPRPATAAPSAEAPPAASSAVAAAEPTTPAPAPTPPGPTATPTSKEPVASADKPESAPDLLFQLDSNQLTLTAKGTLDEVVKQLKANPGLRIHVRGHSDRLGSYEHNLELSRRRAAAVENYLLANGVTGSRISTEAVGGSKPADPSNTPTAWARNRRVELEWR